MIQILVVVRVSGDARSAGRHDHEEQKKHHGKRRDSITKEEEDLCTPNRKSPGWAYFSSECAG
jgi:hypothetical protein